jgi:hypothetical protein
MRRVTTVLFWFFIALDVAVLGLWLVLGLAAAKPSHTPLSQVVAFFAVPTLLLGLVLLLHGRGPWAFSKPLATVLAAVPALLVVGGALLSRSVAGWLGMPSDDWGRPDPVRQQQLEAAIRQGDAAAVARTAAAPDARLNDGAALVAALRRLETEPGDLAPLRALLAAGVRPTGTGGAADPLAEAIRASRWAGPEPVRLLLEAGADPNRRHGVEPAWFAALAPAAHPAVLPLLLARGVDLKAVDMAGQSGVHWAAHHRNWAAAALLVEHGAQWRSVQVRDGRLFKSVVDAERRRQADDPGLQRLERLLR